MHPSTVPLRIESIRAGDTIHCRVVDGSLAATRTQFVSALRTDASARATFIASLASAPLDAFFWEMPATSRAHQDRPCEWVLVAAPSLARIDADPTDFAAQFARAKENDVLTFPNLGGDAMLVVPAPRGDVEAYAHLGAFVRRAPAAQVDSLVALLGAAIEARLSDRPTWVSTAGLGVSWLHLRLDTRPKYYRHAPYKHPP